MWFLTLGKTAQPGGSGGRHFGAAASTPPRGLACPAGDLWPRRTIVNHGITSITLMSHFVSNVTFHVIWVICCQLVSPRRAGNIPKTCFVVFCSDANRSYWFSAFSCISCISSRHQSSIKGLRHDFSHHELAPKLHTLAYISQHHSIPET